MAALSDQAKYMRILVIISMAFISITLHAEENSIIGKWRLIEASFPLPESCKGLWYEFTDNGKLVSSDGNLQEIKKYKTNIFKNGIKIEMTYVSNNGSKNCQGLEPHYVKKNTYQSIYAEFEARNKLKIFFGKSSEGDYVLLKRQ